MKTKIGEIKSIKDIFEEPKEVSRNSDEIGGIIWITAMAKCKVCGDEVSGLWDEYSAGGTFYKMLSGEMEKHIDLHNKLSFINNL